MKHISIISSSVRVGRKSDRVALYFEKYLTENKISNAEILDLAKYDFPIFTQKLSEQTKPAEKVIEFADKIKASDGIIIITPEYNGGYPASLKNVIDLLYDEWHRKPIAIVTVSGGVFGGTQALISLQFTLWKVRANTVTAMFPVRSVQETFDENGDPINEKETNKLAAIFIKELIFNIENTKILTK